MKPDILLRNGKVRTLDHEDTTASAIALAGDRIVWVGEDSDAPAGAKRIVDLAGRCVLPGFTDSHVHLVAYSVGLSRIDLWKLGSLDEALEEVGRRARAARPGQWILGRGWVFRGWGLESFPDRGMLDGVSSDVPVALSSVDGHVIWVNSAALAAASIGKNTPDPHGGEIERDGEGFPTGILKEKAADHLKEIIPVDPPDQLASALLKGQAAFHGLGITSVHDLERRKALRAFTRLHGAEGLKLRVRYFVAEEELGAAEELGVEAGLGDDHLRIVGIKSYADGSLLSETAYMLEPYGKTQKRGIPVATPEYLE
ncbi:MAG: amidohydrolase, partial [Planctomycetota bacterium]